MLPENLLKLYLQFSAPMGRGDAYATSDLRAPRARTWTSRSWNWRGTLGPERDAFDRPVRPRPDQDRAETARGARPGPPRGARPIPWSSTRGWRDAEGRPLAVRFCKAFRAGPPDETPPDPSTWAIDAPGPGTSDPLTLTSPSRSTAPSSAACATIYDADGHVIPGGVAVEDGETALAIHAGSSLGRRGVSPLRGRDLEDLAGNSIGRVFEVDVFEKVDRRPIPQAVNRPFRVEARSR